MPKLNELDFAKGVLIYLMVMFHLPLPHSIRDLHSVVYSFHMSGFLVMSGFLSNFNKPVKDFLKNYFRKILVPFLLFELAYLVSLFLCSSLGIANNSNSFTDFTISGIATKLLLSPIGTYWYLHTLFIGISVAFFLNLITKNKNGLGKIILLGIIYWIISQCIPGFAFENAVYLLVGIALKENKKFIPSNIWAIIPFLLIINCSDKDFNRFTLEGMSLTILFLSFLCSLYYILCTHKKSVCFASYFSFIGKNSIAIVVLSPLLTSILKLSTKFFAIIDASGFLFLFIATITTVHLSFLGLLFFDSFKLSRLLFGTSKAFSPFKLYPVHPSNKTSLQETINEAILADQKFQPTK